MNRNLLPKKLIVQFDQGNVLNKISSGSGVVSISHITNYDDNRHFTLFKLLNKKMYYEHVDSTFEILETLPEFDIYPTEGSKIIVGYPCKKATVVFKDSIQHENFEVYYTENVDLEHLNHDTPYSPINGLLLDFRLKINGNYVHLIAEEISTKKIKKGHFTVPDDYEKINKETMKDILELLK